MQAFPTRIEGVKLARSVISRRIDGSLVIRRPSDLTHGVGEIRFRERLTAESGFTARPSYCRQVSVARTLSCIEGEIYAVVVDVRLGSTTFGQWQGFYLDEKDSRTLLVPSGVALGWQVASGVGQLEVGSSAARAKCKWCWLTWDDPAVGLQWPISPTSFASQRQRSLPLSSIPDAQLPDFAQIRAAVLPPTVAQPIVPKPTATKAGSSLRIRRSRSPEVAQPRITPSMPTKSLVHRNGPILIVGSTGQLGHDLVRHFKRLGPVIGACRTPDKGSLLPIPMQVDVSRPASLRQAIRTVRPSLIVNAAGLTDIDVAENSPRLAQLVNATAPAIIAEEALRVGAGVIHFCSDMVFGGLGDRPFREGDAPNPQNQFARTKLVGCQAIQSSGVPHLILRAGWLYSTRGNNYVRRIIDLLTYRNAITLPSDQRGCPTSTDWLASTTAHIVSDAEGDYASWMQDWGGLFHASMLGYASRVEVGDQIVATCKGHALPVTLSRIQSLPLSELPSVAKVPANCQLDPSKLTTAFDLVLPRWQEEINRQIATILGDRLQLKQVA